MTDTPMSAIMESYRTYCNQITYRINDINLIIRTTRLSENEYQSLSRRRRVLREERLDLLYAMKAMKEYCR